jgi:sugar lactone lactonase YvrE
MSYEESCGCPVRRLLLLLTFYGFGAGLLVRAQPSAQLAANAELGQPNFTSSTCDNPILKPARMLCHPVGVGVNNTNGLLFVAAGDDNRILIWPSASKFSNAQPASVVLGQPDFTIGRKCSGGTTATTICDPNAATVDANGNLWIADTDGDRILRFSPPFANDMPADMVIGQRDFNTSICGVDAWTLCAPRDLKFDAFGNLWVADSDNNRVLMFSAPLSNGEAASLVIGQPDFTSKHCNRGSATPAADTLCGPKGLTLDSSRNLWVAEDDNSRVLEYNDPLHSSSSDISANLVYGEPDFSTMACNVGANGVCHPDRVALGRSGQLLISDSDNNRLLVVDNPLSNTIANQVIGQPDFTSNVPGTTASGFAGPKGLTVDSKGNIYVTDEDNNRVVEPVLQKMLDESTTHLACR